MFNQIQLNDELFQLVVINKNAIFHLVNLSFGTKIMI